MKKILLSWSGGKDSAWALHLLRQSSEYEVAALLTTVNEKFRRVAIHGFREELLDRQAQLAGLPLWKIDLPFPCSNEEYETRMSAACLRAVREGFTGVAFGDLFLEDIRAYRIAKLAGTGLEPIFPVWGIPTDRLAGEMMAGGLRARLTCVDPRKLPAEFAGREWDHALLDELPATVDPCGENGEFHSFCWAGPMFSSEIPVQTGERVLRDGFSYADMIAQS
ncbi:ATP-binding protein [Edaphobacter sp.]|uniref:Dph6-related ATP pyrophosphatase n=1 Tax=Edaphobacter sp. TaxID=1934404 RepID=UPI002DB7AF81|nr:ATP-binding protein [Edaphobacter sp.]HEU5340720.1 ATP-binding protein [Edaphobacter sp.]